MVSKFILSLLLVIFVGTLAIAQQAIIQLENYDNPNDETLPISATRYDDAVELPKDNFSSVGKNDKWEKFERGELDEKAFVRLQEEYQAAANSSKDPYVKRKLASDARDKKIEERQKKKEERDAKIAEEKKKKKKEDAGKFDKEVDLMAKEKEVAQDKAEAEEKAAVKAQEKADAKAKALAKAKGKKTAKNSPKKGRTPASAKKKSGKVSKKK